MLVWTITTRTAQPPRPDPVWNSRPSPLQMSWINAHKAAGLDGIPHQWNCCSSFKFLGAHILDNLSWSTKTSNLSSAILVNCWCATERILTSCATVWYRKCSIADCLTGGENHPIHIPAVEETLTAFWTHLCCTCAHVLHISNAHLHISLVKNLSVNAHRTTTNCT